MREEDIRLSFYATLRYHSCYFLPEGDITVNCHLVPNEEIKAVILCLRKILKKKLKALRRFHDCHGRYMYLMSERDIIVTFV